MKSICLGVGPLTGKIYIQRVGRRGDALEKRDVTEEAILAVLAHMQHDGPAGCGITFSDPKTKKPTWKLVAMPVSRQRGER